MSVTQYIGARYVPLFADPLTWDITKAYEALTIVYYQGNSFTSRQAVPAGIDITNDQYWALTGNYNAQIEQYRAEVQTYDSRITANTSSNTAQDAQLAGTSSSGLKTLIETNASDIDALELVDTAMAAQLAGTESSGLKTLIDANTTANTAQDAQLAGTSSSGLKTLIDTLDSQMSGVASSGLKTLIGDVETLAESRGINNNTSASEAECSIFIAGTTGDDANEGTSDNDAVQTLERALELARERSWANVYLRFRESGAYVCTSSIFSSMSVHWSAGSAATSVVVRFTQLCSVYNCYWNIGTYSGNTFRFEFEAGWHVDHSNLYIQHAQLVVTGTYDFNGSVLHWINVTVNTAAVLRPIDCTINIVGATFNYSGGTMVMYAQNCRIESITSTILVNVQGTPNAPAFRFDECFVTLLNSFAGTGSKFTAGVLLVRSFLFTSATTKASLLDLAPDANHEITGNNAVYKATNTLLELT